MPPRPPTVRPAAIGGLLAALAGCGSGAGAGAPPPPTPADTPALRAHADPASWERLDDADPARRLRDPRTGMVFVRVPAGSFTSRLRARDQTVERTVTVTRPFLLAETELCAAQWRRYVAARGADPGLPVPAADALPMPVSWLDAEAFCADLGYRLPTEAEWELACRADHGPDDAPWSTQVRLHAHAWFNANAGDGPRPVAGRTPNGYGLFDMIGNVWEWCADRYDHNAPFGPGLELVDPTGADRGEGRALRGGSWFTPGSPGPTYRTQDYPTERNMFYGLRPARTL